MHWLDSLAESIPSPSPYNDEGGTRMVGVSPSPPAVSPSAGVHSRMEGKARSRDSLGRDPSKCNPTTALDTSQEPHRKERAGGVAPPGTIALGDPTSDKTAPQADTRVRPGAPLGSQGLPSAAQEPPSGHQRICSVAQGSVLSPPLSPPDDRRSMRLHCTPIFSSLTKGGVAELCQHQVFFPSKLMQTPNPSRPQLATSQDPHGLRGCLCG